MGRKKYSTVKACTWNVNPRSCSLATNKRNLTNTTIDAQMTFQPLAKQVLKQTAHKVFLLSKVRRFLTSKAAISVYKTKILPYFDYGDIFYLSCPGALLEKLQRIPNRALRICLNSAPREPRIALHKKAGVPLLYDRRLTHVRNFAFKRARKSEYLDIATINTRRNVAPYFKNLER